MIERQAFCDVSDICRLHFLCRRAGIVSTYHQAWQSDNAFSMMVCQNQSQSRPRQVYFQGVFQKICILRCRVRTQVFDYQFPDTNQRGHQICSCKEHCWKKFHYLIQIHVGQHFSHGKLFQRPPMPELWVQEKQEKIVLLSIF